MSAAKILIINVHSAQNAGDRALLECTIQQLQTNFDHPEIKIAANWPDEDYFKTCGFQVVPSFSCLVGEGRGISSLHQLVSAFKGWRLTRPNTKTAISDGPDAEWFALVDAYRWADLVIGVAGNQFHSSGRFSWPFLLMCKSVKMALDFGKPFYTMPQSIGPFRHAWEKRLMGSLYRRGRIIYLRDQVSMELTREIGIGGVSAFAPDPAFAFSPADASRGLEILTQYGYVRNQPSVGITVLPELGRAIHRGNISNYYSALGFALNRLIEKSGVQLFFFNQVTGFSALEDDRMGIQQVINRLETHPENVHWVNSSLSPAELKACYGWMDLFIPARLHSGIFAMGMHVPTLFIGYLTKTRGILQSMGLEDWSIQIEEIDPDRLWQKLEKAWNSREQNAALLKSIIPPIVEAAQVPGTRIAQDFEKMK